MSKKTITCRGEVYLSTLYEVQVDVEVDEDESEEDIQIAVEEALMEARYHPRDYTQGGFAVSEETGGSLGWEDENGDWKEVRSGLIP